MKVLYLGESKNNLAFLVKGLGFSGACKLYTAPVLEFPLLTIPVVYVL